jgi:hypothetical protein
MQRMSPFMAHRVNSRQRSASALSERSGFQSILEGGGELETEGRKKDG